MGVYVGSGLFDSFDPNVGLTRAKDALSLASLIRSQLQSMYTGMNGAAYLYQF